MFRCCFDSMRNPPLLNSSFSSLNSTVIGNLDYDKRSMSNMCKCTTVVGPWVVSIFPNLIMSATDRIRGANLLGLATFSNFWWMGGAF